MLVEKVYVFFEFECEYIDVIMAEKKKKLIGHVLGNWFYRVYL